MRVGPPDGLIEQGQLRLQGDPPRHRSLLDQVEKEGAKAALDLDRPGTIAADLGEREIDEVVPGRASMDEPECALSVVDLAGGDAPRAHPPEEILDLVDRLEGRGRIVDRRRERLDRDVHQPAEGLGGVAALVFLTVVKAGTDVIWPEDLSLGSLDGEWWWVAVAGATLKAPFSLVLLVVFTVGLGPIEAAPAGVAVVTAYLLTSGLGLLGTPSPEPVTVDDRAQIAFGSVPQAGSGPDRRRR